MNGADLAQTGLDLAHPRRARLGLRASRVHQKLERQKMIRIEAQPDLLKREKTAHHQSGSDQEHEGKSYFGHGDGIA